MWNRKSTGASPEQWRQQRSFFRREDVQPPQCKRVDDHDSGQRSPASEGREQQRAADHRQRRQDRFAEDLPPADVVQLPLHPYREGDQQRQFRGDVDHRGGPVAIHRHKDEVGDEVEGESEEVRAGKITLLVQGDKHVLRQAVDPADGQWHAKESIPDGGFEVYGHEEDDVPRKCLAATFDEKGVLHLVFAERGGDVYYLFKREGQWTEPIRIVEKPPYTIYLDLESVKGILFCVYEDAKRDMIYTLTCREGKWSTPQNMGPSEYPSLTSGSDGRIYFLCRNNILNNYNAKLAYRTVDEDDWTFVFDVTDAPRRFGQGPGMAVSQGRMYMAWSNSNGIDGPTKSSLHCAFSYEPGTHWTPRLGGVDPLFYESTGDPHPRIAVFSDGTMLYMNGKRTPRFMLWDGHNWSRIREAPWQSGILQVQCDGKTVWVASSESSRGSGEVSVSGIVHPNVQPFSGDSDENRGR